MEQKKENVLNSKQKKTNVIRVKLEACGLWSLEVR